MLGNDSISRNSHRRFNARKDRAALGRSGHASNVDLIGGIHDYSAVKGEILDRAAVHHTEKTGIVFGGRGTKTGQCFAVSVKRSRVRLGIRSHGRPMLFFKINVRH